MSDRQEERRRRDREPVGYYSDFPVVRIRDGGATGWHNDIKGASALAVAGSRVALFGGYGPDYDRLVLVNSGKAGLELV